jgi:catechol 2,3-dioxygenase-like lactoylglutathione lyase family enzyme
LFARHYPEKENLQLMINGAHVIIYSKDAEADRSFFKDVLGLDSVDAGGGWLIFALPPAEVACHPGDENDQHELYLMCQDLKATTAALAAKGITCGEVQEPPWGSLTSITLPGGGQLGLYQPKHPTAAKLD